MNALPGLGDGVWAWWAHSLIAADCDFEMDSAAAIVAAGFVAAEIAGVIDFAAANVAVAVVGFAVETVAIGFVVAETVAPIGSVRISAARRVAAETAMTVGVR